MSARIAAHTSVPRQPAPCGPGSYLITTIGTFRVSAWPCAKSKATPTMTNSDTIHRFISVSLSPLSGPYFRVHWSMQAALSLFNH
jgi:hypothetical protein